MKCNSQADLHRRMADVYDFCKGTVFEGKEYLCVKADTVICSIVPVFNPKSTHYEFALGILGDVVVWADSVLYDRSGVPTVVGDAHLNLAYWSWNPPAPPKPKTVFISANKGEPIVLTLPDGVPGNYYGYLNLTGKKFWWKEGEARNKFDAFITDLLEGRL